MSLEEFEKAPDPKTKRYAMMRSISDYGMGILYIAIGVIIFFARQFNFNNDFVMTIPAKIFAVVAIIYGVWRMYRGYKKNYFRNDDV